MAGVVLWVLALTSLHPGVGRSEESYVDLPVQRDEFGLPTIWASSLKGAVRSKAESKLFKGSACAGNPADCAKVIALFGPRPESAHEHAASVAFLDAKLFAIPARSLKGIWLYVTSPLLIGYAKLYAQALEATLNLPDVPPVSPGEVALSDPSYAHEGKAVINEIAFKVAEAPASAFSIPPVEEVKKILGKAPAFAVVNDGDLQRVVRRSLLVQYRVRLDREKKTVEVGPWSEEYIPPFTIFISGLHCSGRIPQKVKVKKQTEEGEEVVKIQDPCKEAAEMARGPIWMGGKETVGRGLAEIL